MDVLVDSTDHVRGAEDGRLVLVYGDYECPYTRMAMIAIERARSELGDRLRLAYRHFPLTEIHPHALGAAQAAEAAHLQGRFWAMHDLLFHRQKALSDGDLRAYAEQIGLDGARFDDDRRSAAVLERVQRDIDSGTSSGEVNGTPTIFVDGRLYDGSYSPPDLVKALS